MSNEKQIIEINGIKMEVDLRHATKLDYFIVGDPVRLLLIESNEVKSGIVVGFEQFKSLPTIVIAYLKTDYWTTGIDFAYVNTKSASKYEIIPADADTVISVDKASIVSKMDDDISKKLLEVEEMRRKKEFFLKRFGIYFSQIKNNADAQVEATLPEQEKS